MSEGAQNRIPSLDGWRAVAITLVLAAHTISARGAPQTGPFDSLYAQGNLGVRIFFVLSGYLITRLMVSEAERNGRVDLKAFYLRRGLRILPVYYLYLAVLACLMMAGLYRDTLSSWIGALTFTRNVVGVGSTGTAHLWSLAVEEQFYLVWPLTFAALALQRRWRLGISILGAVLVAGFALRAWPCQAGGFVCERVLGPASLPHYADVLGVGCAWALLEPRFRDVILTRATSLSILYGSVAGLIGTAFLKADGPVAVSSLITLQAGLTMTAMASSAATKGTIVYKALTFKPVVWLGLISYSLYIWHVLFVASYVEPELASAWFYDWRIWWASALITGAASYFLFERRFVALRRRFGSRPLGSPATGLPTSAPPLQSV